MRLLFLLIWKRNRRAFPAVIGGAERWVAADDGPRLSAVLGIAVPSWAQREGKLSRPLDGLAARFARTHGPFDSEEAAFSLGVGVALAAESLERLAAEGRLVRLGPDRWADGTVLARLRSRSLARAREAVRPVPADAYVRFLLDRQDVARTGEPTLAGIDGVAQVIAQFEGAALPMEQWERDVLPGARARLSAGHAGRAHRRRRGAVGGLDSGGGASRLVLPDGLAPGASCPVDAQAGVAEVAVAEPGQDDAGALEDPPLDVIVRHVLASPRAASISRLGGWRRAAHRARGADGSRGGRGAAAARVAGEGDQRRSGLSPRRRAGRSGIGVRGQRPDALALAAAGEQPAGPISSQ